MVLVSILVSLYLFFLYPYSNNPFKLSNSTNMILYNGRDDPTEDVNNFRLRTGAWGDQVISRYFCNYAYVDQYICTLSSFMVPFP